MKQVAGGATTSTAAAGHYGYVSPRVRAELRRRQTARGAAPMATLTDAERHARTVAIRARIRAQKAAWARRTAASQPVARRRTPAERHEFTVALRARIAGRKAAAQDRADRRLLGTGGYHILR